MKRVHILLLAGTVLGASSAWADTTYVVDKVTITGSKSVPTAKLLGAIREQKGSRVTQADIVADQDAISKVLGEANVVGGIQTSMATKPNKHIEVTFAVRDEGVQAPTVTKVAAKLHAQIFDGNKSISSDKLAAATGLNPGDELTNDKVLAAENAIGAAYKAAKLPINMSLSGGPQKTAGAQYDLLWHIKETKLAKKDDRSRDAQDQIQ